MKLYKPNKIYIEKSARDYPLTEKILSRLPGIPVEEIENRRSLIESIRQKPDPIGEGKKYLLLARDQGRSFKPFPESEDYLSCDYFTLHAAEGCDLECSYCILQTYLTNPLLTVYVNLEEMLENLQAFLKQNADRFFRIGTGQLADSLSLDHITGFSEILVPFFNRQKNAVLELKTKSTNIDCLLAGELGDNVIVSWSMNSEKIQKEEEHKCASIAERIAAAKAVTSKRQFRTGFHFDPIIDYPGWEKDYEEVIKKISEEIPEDSIAWISLGCLRFMPDLKGIMQERFPKSSLAQAEWIRGMDGKMRYFKPRRIEIYRQMVKAIRRHLPTVTLYLSMESPEVWKQVFGEEHSKNSVCRMLDQAAICYNAPLSTKETP
ncbi:MAG: hypothetical protein HYZ83_08410 [Candidatus Omnitrophica bacterium]|nr:hypothetical protein [Candidatus Omnitrophota bacterium]